MCGRENRCTSRTSEPLGSELSTISMLLCPTTDSVQEMSGIQLNRSVLVEQVPIDLSSGSLKEYFTEAGGPIAGVSRTQSEKQVRVHFWDTQSKERVLATPTHYVRLQGSQYTLLVKPATEHLMAVEEATFPSCETVPKEIDRLLGQAAEGWCSIRSEDNTSIPEARSRARSLAEMPRPPYTGPSYADDSNDAGGCLGHPLQPSLSADEDFEDLSKEVLADKGNPRTIQVTIPPYSSITRMDIMDHFSKQGDVKDIQANRNNIKVTFTLGTDVRTIANKCHIIKKFVVTTAVDCKKEDDGWQLVEKNPLSIEVSNVEGISETDLLQMFKSAGKIHTVNKRGNQAIITFQDSKGAFRAATRTYVIRGRTLDIKMYWEDDEINHDTFTKSCCSPSVSKPCAFLNNVRMASVVVKKSSSSLLDSLNSKLKAASLPHFVKRGGPT